MPIAGEAALSGGASTSKISRWVTDRLLSCRRRIWFDRPKCIAVERQNIPPPSVRKLMRKAHAWGHVYQYVRRILAALYNVSL
jgi:hypothetical protein